MSGQPLRPDEIVARFNSIVRNSAPHISRAPRHRGNFPRRPDDPRLGPQEEVTHSAADLANKGHLAATIVFNILHGFAMELTRVRRVQAWHRTDAAAINDGVEVTALNANFAAYFPIPVQPLVGEVVTDAFLTGFLNSLRIKVQEIRTQPNFTIDIVTCHSSCHNSCHGSRNRR